MSLVTQLRELRSVGRSALYPAYGSEVDIVAMGSGDPALMIPGSAEDLHSGVEVLVFPLGTEEKKEYGTEIGEAGIKVVFKPVSTEVTTQMFIRCAGELYEVHDVLPRGVLDECKLICSRAQNA